MTETDALPALPFPQPSLLDPPPLLVICELLGVPVPDRARFRAWSQTMADLHDRQRAGAARTELVAYMHEPEAAMPQSFVGRPRFARCYARLSPKMEQAGYAEYRPRLLAGLSGRVVEVGAGHGLNFAHYPPEVTGVLAVEPEPYLRQLAQRHAAQAPVPVKVVDGVAEHLPVAGAAFDAAVVSLVLCSVANQRLALAEVHRALRSGGQLRFFEHVRAGTPGLRRVQRLLDATIGPALLGGDHTARDTATAITDAGFTIDQIDRFRIPEERIPLPTSPHILGTATRP